MGLLEIVIGLFLFLFLGVMTLMINPPEKWTRKWTGGKEDEQ